MVPRPWFVSSRTTYQRRHLRQLRKVKIHPNYRKKNHICINMNDPKRIFNLVSYLQYPFMLLGLFFCYKPVLTNLGTVFTNLDTLLVEFNKGLVFVGLGTSFSTLQDTTKVQNKFSQRVYDSPRKTRIFFIIMSSCIVLFIAIGMIGLFGSNKYLQELAYGLISLGVGFIGMLKAAIEIADYQRKKKLNSKE
jgi:hypothetical protein